MPEGIFAPSLNRVKWVRISPEIDWYHYQGASIAPTGIVWHQIMTKTPGGEVSHQNQHISGFSYEGFPYLNFKIVAKNSHTHVVQYWCSSNLKLKYVLRGDKCFKGK